MEMRLTVDDEVSVDKTVQGLGDTALDAMFIGYSVVAVARRQLKTIIKDLEVISNMDDGNQVYNSIIQVAIRQLRTIIEDLELISNMADANNVYYFIIQVMKHQQLNAEVEALRDEVKAEEGRIQECARRLTRAGEVLVGPLKAAKQLLEAGRKAEQAAVDVNEVVNYSQRISGITSAPAWWGPGQRMINFAPPCPRPEQMRAGALSSLSVTTRKSLTSSELLRLARDLDEKLDHGGAGENRDSGQDEDSMGKGDASSDESPGSLHGGKRKHQSGEGEKAPKRDRDGNRSTGQGKQGAGSSKAGRAGSSATGFARDAPVERPKISLDLDDLSDEGSDEGSDEESD